MPSEFELIARYFTRPARRTVLGVGDDAALVRVGAGKELVAAADMLVVGRHFFPDDDPESLGHKALAVNLSDFAAMGAVPRWALLSIALPEVDEAWLAAFTRGLFALADAHGVALIGGDTTRGPLTFAFTVLGEIERGAALRRSGARVGDEVWVSGTLGDAALALAALNRAVPLSPGELAQLLPRLHRPVPRLALGRRLVGVAHAAIDISDGLLADLGHVLEASGVGAEIQLTALPVSPVLAAWQTHAVARRALLAGGDDYELCFTAPRSAHEAIVRLGRRLGVPVTAIGCITRAPGLVVLDGQGRPVDCEEKGFDHFA
ncbi:thiamine-phosphate kinase [Thiobacter aerophilum]|uniref:Thiamine-monophosphate kinase n=1 Tax=Thiobacter aerophilum TaxID=3121275 RepID=A0ABV0EHN7_9BURK